MHVYLLSIKVGQLSLFLGESQSGFLETLVSLLVVLKSFRAVIPITWRLKGLERA